MISVSDARSEEYQESKVIESEFGLILGYKEIIGMN